MKWVSDVDENAPEGVQKTLRGNKADEEQKRQVGSEQGQRLAEEYGMDFYEARACTSLHMKESFTRLTEPGAAGPPEGAGRSADSRQR